MRSIAVAVALLGWPLAAARADGPPSAVRAELDRFYAERLRRPFVRLPGEPAPKPAPTPWAGPIGRLVAGAPAARAEASGYLVELLALASADERSRAAPSRATPYWGGGAEVPARDLRLEVAAELAKIDVPPEALPVLRWYLAEEGADRALASVAAALGKLKTAEADAVRVELAARPHPSALVVAAALRQLPAGAKALPPAVLAELCHHHRAAIRGAARALNARSDGPAPGPFDPVRAVRSRPVRACVAAALALMPELPPAGAKFVAATTRYLDGEGVERERDVQHGWLVRAEADETEIYTPHGRTRAFLDGKGSELSIREGGPDGTRFRRVEVVAAVSVEPAETAGLVAQVEASRKKGEAGHEFSERGPLTGQFRGSGATLFEAVLGAWLFRANRDAEAARVLLPALDSLYRDDHLADLVRDRLGELAGQRMLVAFAGDRDFAAALAHARRIVAIYPGTRFHAYAEALVEQLPRRTEDFNSLRLPTPAEWRTLKATLTRGERIDFLCRRLRLLNCFQEGQPGGYELTSDQFGEPCGLSENAAWGLGRGTTAVVNPWTELTGEAGWRAAQLVGPRTPGLELTLADVPGLAAHLRDDHFLPSVSFWRDFHPDRSLGTTRGLLADLIDGLAERDLCDARRFAGLNAAEREGDIARIAAWAEARAGRSAADLHREALEEVVRRMGPWADARRHAQALVERGDRRAVPILVALLDRTDWDEADRASLFSLLGPFDPAAAAPHAAARLAAGDAEARFLAAAVLVAAGRPGAALPALVRAIDGEGDLSGPSIAFAVRALEGAKTGAARDALGRLIASPKAIDAGAQWRREHLPRLAAAGYRGEVYRFYAALLGVEARTSLGAHRDRPSREAMAAELLAAFGDADGTIRSIRDGRGEVAAKVPALAAWLARPAEPEGE